LESSHEAQKERKTGIIEGTAKFMNSKHDYSFNNGYNRPGSDFKIPKARRSQTKIALESEQYAKTLSSLLSYERQNIEKSSNRSAHQELIRKVS